MNSTTTINEFLWVKDGLCLENARTAGALKDGGPPL